MPDNQIEGRPKRLSQTSFSSVLVFLKYFHLNQIEGSSFTWGWVPESDKGVDHWIIGAKFPQPPNHNNSLTPPPHSPQFTKVHQLKFPLHYMSERRIVGTLEQTCPNLHITILLFLSLTAYSAPSYTNYNFHFTTCWSEGSMEHWSKIAPTST